jgi:hypothetical protein
MCMIFMYVFFCFSSVSSLFLFSSTVIHCILFFRCSISLPLQMGSSQWVLDQTPFLPSSPFVSVAFFCLYFLSHMISFFILFTFKPTTKFETKKIITKKEKSLYDLKKELIETITKEKNKCRSINVHLNNHSYQFIEYYHR